MKALTLGSLFSGSGGFELAGSIFGIEPLWESEIEPLPIRVTERNFPECLKLGDISRIHGWTIPKVDVITGGSPCQDMSIAGKRDGLAGERSVLFNEQIRIVKEMREDDRNSGRAGKDIRCRWMCWENVPGAFTSNQRRDFQSVLTEIVRIAEPEAPAVPIPEKGWPYAGCLMGEHGEWSVAYRTLDAKFWGVPQRRSRIYLVADFAGTTAPEILLERNGLSRHFAESRQARENNHPHPAASVRTTSGCGGHDLGIRPIVLDNHPQDSRIGIREDGMSPTLTEKMGTGGNNVPMVMEPIPINDKATQHDGGGSTRNSDGAGNGLGIGQPGDPSPTLTAAGRHGVAYALDRAAFNQGENALFGIAVEEELSPTIVAKGPNAVIQPTTVPEISGTLTAKMAKGTGGPAGDEMQNLVAEFPDYIVRRFTPLECGRLQGFPDWWCADLGIDQPTFWEVERWLQIFQTYWEVVSSKGGTKAPKTKNQVIKWLQNPASDSALYKMWGNGIALPCAMFVMAGIAKAARGDQNGTQ